jgi:Skp family chaperone for outer membrane proteins
MSNKNFLLLVVWNLALTALLGWALLRKSTPASTDVPSTEVSNPDASAPVHTMTTDTAVLKDAHIAFFFMDSIQSGYELVKESASHVQSMGRQLEGNLAKEMQRAQARAQQLASKDHTYSTQAELEADEKEFRTLEQKIGEMRASSQDRIDELQIKMLRDITLEIQNFLGEYNETHNFDFIFSIQDEGQIWVGNKGLDITADVVEGLNTKHRAKKSADVPAGK